MSLGYLKIETRTLNNGFPIGNSDVTIKSTSGEVLHKLKTDESGNTVIVQLEVPQKRCTLSPNYSGPHYREVDVEVSLPEKFVSIVVKRVQIFDNTTSILPIVMIPKPISAGNIVNVIELPSSELYSKEAREQLESDFRLSFDEEVVIPEYIIVHLGLPDEDVKNIRVGFIDYIKNVASSEMHPTWPQTSLEANICATITFTLNRLYTKWYRNNGYDFDITSSSKVDQTFIEGKNYFVNIGQIVDRVFNEYIVRPGDTEPLFAKYCNGTIENYEGMSKWESVILSNKGLTSIEILKKYYSKDVEHLATNNILGADLNYPGNALKEGDNGKEVRMIQEYLNRISVNYPKIPKIKDVNGIFGADTKRAIEVFQKIFNLTADGKVDKAAWYQIIRMHNKILCLNNLQGEESRINIDLLPDVTLSFNQEGEDVSKLQYILNYIAEFYERVLPVLQNGIFDEETKKSVIEIQKIFGLNPIGIVDHSTWIILYNVYKGIRESIEDKNSNNLTKSKFDITTLTVV